MTTIQVVDDDRLARLEVHHWLVDLFDLFSVIRAKYANLSLCIVDLGDHVDHDLACVSNARDQLVNELEVGDVALKLPLSNGAARGFV